MTTLSRKSPVSFPVPAKETEKREGWEIILEYEGETAGPFITDLSYSAKWDLQSAGLSDMSFNECPVPAAPLQCTISGHTLIARMGNIQASAVVLCDPAQAQPEDPAFTDVTEALGLLAVYGPGALDVLERVTSLDFSDPDYTAPRLFQGPLLHVACQAVVLEKNGTGGCVLISCARGYAAEMAEAILESGHTLGLRPAGEKAFLKEFGRIFS